MEDKNFSLADTFNMKNHADRTDLLDLLAEVRADLVALQSELGGSPASTKLAVILEKLGE